MFFHAKITSRRRVIAGRRSSATRSPGVEDRRVVGVDRLDVGIERHGRLAAFADGDAAAEARPQLVVDGDLFGRLVGPPRSCPTSAAPTSFNSPRSGSDAQRFSVTVPITLPIRIVFSVPSDFVAGRMGYRPHGMCRSSLPKLLRKLPDTGGPRRGKTRPPSASTGTSSRRPDRAPARWRPTAAAAAAAARHRRPAPPARPDAGSPGTVPAAVCGVSSTPSVLGLRPPRPPGGRSRRSGNPRPAAPRRRPSRPSDIDQRRRIESLAVRRSAPTAMLRRRRGRGAAAAHQRSRSSAAVRRGPPA